MLNLKPLPFLPNALEPTISESTVMSHYLGHHRGYVDKYNSIVNKKNAKKEDLLFNLNGHKLHTLYWETLIPGGPTQPRGPLAAQIELQFGDFHNLRAELISQAVNIKGSGWALLLTDKKGKLFVKVIENHSLDQANGLVPLVIIDAWEHAWYLDYGFRKMQFFEDFMALINWGVAEQRYLL